MTFYVLASARGAEPPPTAEPSDSRRFWLESWDGARVLQIGGADHEGPLQLQTGNLGLEVAPSSLYSSGLPGAAGEVVQGTSTPSRPVLLPLMVNTRDQAEQWREVQALRDLTDPARDMTPDGNFRLVCRSASGMRRLNLAYRSGLEGTGGLLPWAARYPLDALAVQPFAEDQAEQVREFALVQDTTPFLGGIWGQIYLVSSAIAGADTPIVMTSAVPVYPTFELTGPASSVLITGDNGLRIDVPAGVAGGATLRIVTSPRGKSVRLDGEPAAGHLARGSLGVPFSLGTTRIDVSAPGADASTQLRISWRGQYRSLW
ncbi:hypothetical protein GCM10027059_25760 [Myceligenerans halotolerans]